jgi:hypothetical protein
LILFSIIPNEVPGPEVCFHESDDGLKKKERLITTGKGVGIGMANVRTELAPPVQKLVGAYTYPSLSDTPPKTAK